MDEGYIKYRSHWVRKAPFPEREVQELIAGRQRLYECGLVGAYPDGVGYGNVSLRCKEGGFYITGSKTGGFPQLKPEHLSRVVRVEVEQNELWCEGPVQASSEAMSHAVLYAECPWVQGVAHVHHRALWERLLWKVPTTDAAATYGSPEMARAIVHLLRTTDLPQRRLFVMAGHPEGLFAFGESLEEAVERLLELL
ncbi:MAG: class II aldolase/adducin family protein [Bacteroidetes bacterium]|nr:MAG: class II aldolase/adducin family protein [Bacteroidota bacterium]